MPKKIALSGKYGQGLCAIVDDEDFDALDQYTWHVADNGYIRTFIGGRAQKKCVSMHRLIMNPPDDFEIDHKDGNKLNNQRSNLRVSTRSENAKNIRRHKKFSSRFKGVSWSGKDQFWDASITVDGKSIFLGLFSSEIQAARAYNEGALKHFDEFASLNHIPEDVPDDIRYRQGKALKTSKTSKYRGVSFSKSSQRWVANITINKQHFCLGSFSTQEEAARTYDKFALKHRGIKALLNFPEDARTESE